jgi:uncharacterized protein YjbI with pentapeptide repeats
MCGWRTILILTLLIAAAGAHAEEPGPSTQARPGCAVPSDPGWTPQEKFVWERVCVGAVADFNSEAPYGGRLDPRKLGTLPDDRILRPVFLEAILLDDRYRGLITRRGVRIFGARFPDLIDLQNASLQNELWLEGCLLEKGVDLSWSKSTQAIGIHASKVGETLNLYGLQVAASNLSLADSELADVVLLGASIGHTLDLTGAKVTGTLNADSLQVGVYLFMSDAEFADIVLRNARVPTQLTLERSKVSGSLNMYGVQVGGDLFMYNSEFAGLDLEDAQIGGQVDFSGSSFNGNTNLTGTRIGGALQFVSAGRSVRWSDKGLLVMRNVKADAIPGLSEPWPNKFNLDGLTYRNSGSVGPDFDRWFDRLAAYSRQPFEQLATVLQVQGDVDTATAVRYSARDRERRELPSPGRYWQSLLDQLVGYGYYPERSFRWAVLFVILGAVVLRVSGQGPKNGMPFGLAYSFDMLLPIVRLREAHYSIDLVGPARYYFYAHRLMGWVLASFLVAGISGLTK